MGGTGVTTSNPGNAAFHNAAMLASAKDKNEDDFAWEIPIVTVRLQDEQNLRNDLSQLQTDGNNLTTSSTAFQTAYNNFNAAGGQTAANLTALQNSAGAVGTALGSFNTSLKTINQKSVAGNALVGTLMSFPSKKYAVSLYYDVRAEVGGMFNYATADQTSLNNLSNNLIACGNATTANAQTVCGAALGNGTGTIGANGQVNGLTSQLLVRGVKARDIGIAMARQFDLFGGMDIGVVPKMTKFSTYDFAIAAQNNPKLTLNQGQKDFSAFNLDMGAAKIFKTAGGDDIKAGLAVRDLLSKNFVTVLGNTISVKPHATLGVSYVTKLTTTGLDLDVTANQPMIGGLIKPSQFLRIGTEFDAWGWMQIRLGYRHDLKGNYVGLPSLGLGLSPFGGAVHFDLSAAYASKKEGAASAQLGFRF